MSAKVHLNLGGGSTACGAEYIWVRRIGGGSTDITSNKSPQATTCKNCLKTFAHYQKRTKNG